MGGELRIGVVMSGGVSLAVWMGGVAHQLLRLVQSPGKFGLPRQWKPSIDVIAGTSAGGLNGALLGAALAWGIDSNRFRDDVRNTWLEMGSFQTLLRSPFEADPPSLFKGDEVLLEGVSTLLQQWWNEREGPLPAFRMHLVMTTTLLNPELGSYHDDLDMKIIEPHQAGAFTFKTDDFASQDIVPRLALAARASSSFPVAFEPTFVPVGGTGPGGRPDMVKYANFSKSRLTVDGGVIVNRPFHHALEGIIEQPATDHVERWLAYVVPDPDPTDRPNEPDSLDPPLSLTKMIGKVAAAGLSQSLSEDLEDWQERERVYSRQRNHRYWLADLKTRTRNDMLNQAYPRFLEQRTGESARATVNRLLASGSFPPDAKWRNIETALRKARRQPGVDWHPASWEDAQGSDPTTFPWQWGLASLEYLSQIVLDLIAKTWPQDDASAASDARERIHKILEVLRRYRDLDEVFWRWAVRTKPRSMEWQTWATATYQAWPQLDPSAPQKDREQASEYIEAIKLALPTASEYLAGDPAPLTQNEFRLHLSALAGEIAQIYRVWRTYVDFDPQVRVNVVGAPGAHPSDESPLSDLATLADTIGGRRASSARVIRSMIGYWVIQMVSQPQGIVREQPIQLAQISADIPSCVNRSFATAADKLAGVQLAHFGAFYKRSWRANDWMWGELDGIDRIFRLCRAVARDEGDSTETIADAQRRLLTKELVALRREIGISHEVEGGGLSAQAKLFGAKVDEELSDGSVPEGRTGYLLGLVPRERVVHDIASNQFAQTLTTTAGVAATTLQGSRGGLGSFRHVFGQIRRLVILPFYLLAHAVTTGSAVASFTAFSSFLLAATLLVVDIALPGAGVPSLLLALSWATVAFWLLFSMSRASVGLRGLMATVAVIPILAISGAFLIDWATGGALEKPNTCTIPLDQVDLDIGAGNAEVTLNGCDAPQSSTDESRTVASRRASQARTGIAVVIVLATVGTLLLRLLMHRWPVFLAGFTAAVSALGLLIRPTNAALKWVVFIAIGLWLLGLLVWRVTSAPGANLSATAETTRKERFRIAASVGLITGVGFAAIAGLAVRLGEATELKGSIWPPMVRWVTEKPGWALIAIVLFPSIVGVISSAVARGRAASAGGSNVPAAN